MTQYVPHVRVVVQIVYWNVLLVVLVVMPMELAKGVHVKMDTILILLINLVHNVIKNALIV